MLTKLMLNADFVSLQSNEQNDMAPLLERRGAKGTRWWNPSNWNFPPSSTRVALPTLLALTTEKISLKVAVLLRPLMATMLPLPRISKVIGPETSLATLG